MDRGELVGYSIFARRTKEVMNPGTRRALQMLDAFAATCYQLVNFLKPHCFFFFWWRVPLTIVPWVMEVTSGPHLGDMPPTCRYPYYLLSVLELYLNCDATRQRRHRSFAVFWGWAPVPSSPPCPWENSSPGFCLSLK